ncbi:MAG: hypothetical protein WKF97_07060 [Chitinophagaceae bacterium]
MANQKLLKRIRHWQVKNTLVPLHDYFEIVTSLQELLNKNIS